MGSGHRAAPLASVGLEVLIPLSTAIAIASVTISPYMVTVYAVTERLVPPQCLAAAMMMLCGGGPVGTAVGQAGGRWLTDSYGNSPLRYRWRSRSVRSQTPPEPRTRLDITSGALTTTGLGATVLGVSLAARHGWSSPAVVAMLVSGAALGVGFILRQRLVTSPLVPLDILRNRSRVAAHVAAAAGVVGMSASF